MFKKALPFMISISFTIIAFLMAISFRKGNFEIDLKIIKLIRFPEISVLAIGTLASVISTFAIHLLTKNRVADIGTLGMTGVNLLLLTIIYGYTSLSLFLKISEYVLPIGYFIVSFLILFLIYVLTIKFHYASNKIILIGIVFTLTISAFSHMILSSLPHTKQIYLTNFSIGAISIGSNILQQTKMIIAYILLTLAIILLIVFFKKIKIVYSDMEKAISIGINTQLIRAILFIVISLGSTVAFICLGSVAFIGFIATNIIYLFYKNVSISQLILSLLIGLALMFCVYFIKGNIISASIPIGIITNIISIPYLIFVLWKGDK